jgi:replication-associated recombination protein RarA
MEFYDFIKPRKINHFIPDSEKELFKLEMIVQNKITFPSPAKTAIILHGGHGAGKTELAKFLPKILESYRSKSEKDTDDGGQSPHLFYNFIACETVTTAQYIKMNMSTSSLFADSGFTYMIFDEFDNLRPEVQRNLKSYITSDSNIVFIMTTNNIKKIDPSLISRSHLISFENPSEDLWMDRLSTVLEKFNVVRDENYLRDLIKTSKCDARIMLSELEEYILLEA